MSDAAEIATRANRTLSIYTTDLEPLIYDHDLFLEPVKRLVLARSHAPGAVRRRVKRWHGNTQAMWREAGQPRERTTCG